ncbi:Flp pilus assembly complex ATPase component TadA [bacterium]|nr:Flp pilus assembly complex ATPase component TadA [bacterium]
MQGIARPASLSIMASPQEPNRAPATPGAAAARPTTSLGAFGGPANIEKTVNDLIMKAHRAGASDLHFEPYSEHLLVRARIDGALLVLEKLPVESMKQVVARVKIMCNLEVSDGRAVVDGRFHMGKHDPAAKELDVRCVFVPAFFGEKVVLRLVDHSKLKLSLDELGFTPENARLYEHVLQRPSGLVLHVGPQASGKTTTAYAGLKFTARPSASVVTIEEMVEYVLPGVTQTQVDPESGLTFGRVLQGILRQDPDVILVSELRDGETARLAVEAAMTGKLVISTLHALGPLHAVQRLTELGLPRGLVAHALAGVVSQRLVRRLCADCREKVAPSTLIRSAMSLPPSTQSVWKPKGCRKCGKGFRGRVAVLEVLPVSDRIHEAIASSALPHQVEAIAIAEGSSPLVRDAVDKVMTGATAVEEVLRVLCGVSVEDVSAITDPAEMVTFLKTVRDQFLPSAPAPGVSPPAIPRPAKATTSYASGTYPVYDDPRAAAPATTARLGRPPSGTYPIQDEPRQAGTTTGARMRPPSGSYPMPEDSTLAQSQGSTDTVRRSRAPRPPAEGPCRRLPRIRAPRPA